LRAASLDKRDDTVSMTVADEHLEILRQGLSDFVDLLNTPDEREELRSIIEACDERFPYANPRTQLA